MSTQSNWSDALDLRPLDDRPASIHPPYTVGRPRTTGDLEAIRLDFLAAITAPLADLPLGDYDRRIVAWLAHWDVSTVGAIASLLHRARAAEPLPGSAVPEAGERR